MVKVGDSVLYHPRADGHEFIPGSQGPSIPAKITYLNKSGSATLAVGSVKILFVQPGTGPGQFSEPST
jgi:hypothetical protein